MREGCFLIFFLALGAFCFQGCSPEAYLDEKDETHYVRGQKLLRENRPQEALAAFLKVTEKRRDAADSHLEAGNLYLDVIKDPVLATYHFRRYLELRPQSEEAPHVRQRLETCTKEFIRQLPGNPFGEQLERADLMQTLRVAQTENAALKRENAELRRQLGAAAGPVAVVAVTPAPAVQNTRATAPPAQAQRSYTVVQGDTLSKISEKVYGNRNQWQKIYEANRDRLSSPGALKIGQQLRVP